MYNVMFACSVYSMMMVDLMRWLSVITGLFSFRRQCTLTMANEITITDQCFAFILDGTDGVS